MSLLTKEQILNAQDLSFELLDIPEWGGQVKVQVMSGFARDRFESSVMGKGGGVNLSNIRAKLAAATIVDDKGDTMFNEEDIVKLGKKSAAALDRVMTVAQKINRISDKDVEQLAKNS